MTGEDSGEQPVDPVHSGDDPTIPNDELVYRRLSDPGPNMITVDTVTHVRRPTSGAFKPDDDGVSVFRRSKLEEEDLGPEDVVTTEESVVVSLTVEDVRTVKPLGLCDDPWPQDVPDAGHPRYCAHALIVGWHLLHSKGERRKCQQALAKAPSLQFIDSSSTDATEATAPAESIDQ